MVGIGAFSKALDPEENFHKSGSAAFAPREKDIPNFSLPIFEQSWFLEWKERNVKVSNSISTKLKIVEAITVNLT